MRGFESFTPSDIKAYVAAMKEEENRGKLITIIAIGAVIIGLLTVGIIYLIKNRNDDDEYDEWDDWDDDNDSDEYEEDADGECCCTDKDVDKSVKVEPIDK